MSKRFLLALILSTAATAQVRLDEYAVKAAFLYNFSKFVDWPPSKDPFAICVLGRNPFGQSLEQILEGKTIENRPLAVREISEVDNSSHCQIVFISSSEQKQLVPIIAGVAGTGALTVGDTPGFAEKGGVVNLALEGGRVHIEINLEAARQQNLRISSKLLSLARIVKN